MCSGVLEKAENEIEFFEDFSKMRCKKTQKNVREFQILNDRYFQIAPRTNKRSPNECLQARSGDYCLQSLKMHASFRCKHFILHSKSHFRAYSVFHTMKKRSNIDLCAEAWEPSER
jgi:hypothetical protein